MRNLTRGFTMRKGGTLPRGDWFTMKKEANSTKVYIYDEIGFWGTSATDFVNQLKDVKGAIDVHLNSPGGEIFDGLAIYNTLKQHSGTVNVYVDGLAASAASFIAQAGDKVTMARNAQMMIHDGIGMAYGNEATMLEMASLLGQISNNIADIYAFNAKARGSDNTLEDFRALMREEVWYNGHEAVDAGLADEVLDRDEEAADEVENKWDLSLFNHAGRKNAESPLRVRERLRLSNATEKEKDVSKKDDKTPAAPPAPADPAAADENTNAPADEGTTAPADEGTTAPADEGTNAPADEGTTEETPEEVDEYEADPTQSISPRVREGGPTAQAGVMVNGVRTTDWAKVQAHIAALEGSQAESQSVHRKNAIEALASANKIPASQVDSLVNLVNGDGDKVPAMSSEQYAAFMASYESMPSIELFAQHGKAEGDASTKQSGTGLQMSDADKADRISVLQGIVGMNERTMSPEDVKNTKSYTELQMLLGNNES